MLVAVLSVLMPLQPIVPSISYVMAAELSVEQGAKEGQALWGDIKGGLAFPDTQGGTTFRMADGEQVPINELFQAKSRDDSFKSMFTLSDSEFEKRGLDARTALIEREKTPEGQAYRTLRESAYRSRPDLSKDPIWGSTDAVFDFIAGKPVNCTAPDDHKPDYRTCERVNLNTSSCSITHDYDIGIFEHISGPVNMASCGEGCMDFWLGKIGDNYYSGHCKIYEEAMSIKMLNPNAILDAKIVYAKWDDYMQIWVGDTKAWAGPNGNFPPETEGACELATSWETNPNTDVTNLFKNRTRGETVNMKVRVSVTGGGEGYAKIRLYYDPNKVVNPDEWQNAACIKKAKIYEAQYGSSGASCERMPALNPQGCITKNGVTACANAFEQPPFAGVSPFCQKVAVSPPASLKAGDTCTQYEQSPTCGFITSQCNGLTPREYIEQLYRFGLGRAPDQAGINYWLNRFNELGGDYEYVRSEFFRAADFNDEEVINTFSCSTFVETYDCGYKESSNSGACAVQDLFKDEFADCVEDLVPTEVKQTVKIEKTETCEEALKLTECRVERELTPVARSSETTYTRGCFITEEVAYRLPWASKAIAGSVSITSSGLHTSAEITQQPSVANDWTARVKLNGSGQMVTKTRQVGRTCNPGETAPCYTEEQYQVLECPTGSSLSATLKAQGYAMEVEQKETPAEQGNAPCLRDTDEWTDTTWVCEQQSPTTVKGVSFTTAALAAALDPMYPGAPATCIRGKATYQTKAYGEGEFCWTDMQGKQQCQKIDSSSSVKPGSNTCSALQQRTAKGECRYDGRFPVEDGEGSTGFQYVWEHRYTCVQSSKEVTTTELAPQYTCEGIVRCMGTECMTPNRQSSPDFGKAAAMLQAVQQIGQDVTCDASTGGDLKNCRVFSGEASTCKMALGGYVDCCESPGGVSIGDYITMLKATARMDNYLTSESVMQPIRGSYSALRDPVVDSVQYAKQAFTEQLDNLSGAIFGEGGGGAAGGALDAAKVAMEGFQQAIMSGANDFLAETFGQEVASMFFDVAADGVVSLAGPFAAALSVIGLIYTIYSIAKILVNIVWKCSEDELALGVDIELHKSHFVGSYCAKKTIVGCVEKRKSYCVFSSPLARIINEQARPQLGRGWGTPKSPDCSGITLAELERLDWNQIDLTEWMDLLKITDNMPGMQDLDIENLTGSGSWLGQSQAASGETRLNTADRNRERLEGTDLQKLNQEAAEELWRGQ